MPNTVPAFRVNSQAGSRCQLLMACCDLLLCNVSQLAQVTHETDPREANR